MARRYERVGVTVHLAGRSRCRSRAVCRIHQRSSGSQPETQGGGDVGYLFDVPDRHDPRPVMRERGDDGDDAVEIGSAAARDGSRRDCTQGGRLSLFTVVSGHKCVLTQVFFRLADHRKGHVQRRLHRSCRQQHLESRGAGLRRGPGIQSRIFPHFVSAGFRRFSLFARASALDFL